MNMYNSTLLLCEPEQMKGTDHLHLWQSLGPFLCSSWMGMDAPTILVLSINLNDKKSHQRWPPVSTTCSAIMLCPPHLRKSVLKSCKFEMLSISGLQLHVIHGFGTFLISFIIYQIFLRNFSATVLSEFSVRSPF